MTEVTQERSATGRIVARKLDPGVFVVEIPEVGRRVSVGQPPDVIKRLQQAGYRGPEGVTDFVLVDSKLQGDSTSWVLVEFPVLYALYAVRVPVDGRQVPAFFAGRRPRLIGLPDDLAKAMRMVKLGNYGVDRLDEIDAWDLPEATREALRREILGLAVGNRIQDSDSFLEGVALDPVPRSEHEFSDMGDGIRIGRIARNTYRFVYGGDSLDVDVTLLPGESFRSPVEYRHRKFPVISFGIWHTGEFDGMDPYGSSAHTTLIHRYQPIMIDYPANMTDIINHYGLSKQAVGTVILTHNHDDHIGALIELLRRSERTHLVTTEPVQSSVLKKLAALADLPEDYVRGQFEWTLLPFLADRPYQTESLNLDGLHVTGHLSCHSVPTTVYTFRVQHEGHPYDYGHFLDMVAFRRMARMVEEGWMPAAHLEYLDDLVRRRRYQLVKYDAGCPTDEDLPFTVHGQWQDLIGSPTERQFRVFTHTSKHLLDPAHEREGRFVSVGDVDATYRRDDGRLLTLAHHKGSVTAFFSRAMAVSLAYLESLPGTDTSQARRRLLTHYAMAFADCPKAPDPNIGSWLFEQGDPCRDVTLIVRGRVEITERGEAGRVIVRSTVAGGGEVMGDVEAAARLPHLTSARTLNRVAHVAIPVALFQEALDALGIEYEGRHASFFTCRRLLQITGALSRDLSSTMVNRLALAGELRSVAAGEPLVEQGDADYRLLVCSGTVNLTVGERTERIPGPTVIGECELFTGRPGLVPPRRHSARAAETLEVATLSPAAVREMPVVMDNLLRLVRARRSGIYQDLVDIEPRLVI